MEAAVMQVERGLAVLALRQSGALAKFMNVHQRFALTTMLGGAEGAEIARLVLAAVKAINDCPVTYQTAEQDDPIAVLHYFLPNGDAWITEKDIEGGVEQAFGWAGMNGEQPEAGYVSILEWVANGAELDLHWTPAPISQVLAKHQR